MSFRGVFWGFWGFYVRILLLNRVFLAKPRMTQIVLLSPELIF